MTVTSMQALLKKMYAIRPKHFKRTGTLAERRRYWAARAKLQCRTTEINVRSKVARFRPYFGFENAYISEAINGEIGAGLFDFLDADLQAEIDILTKRIVETDR